MPEIGPAAVSENPDVRYERSDFSPPVVAIVGGTTVAIVVVVLGVAWSIFSYLESRESEMKASSQPLAQEDRKRLDNLPADQRLRNRFHGEPPLEGLLRERPRGESEADRERLQSYDWVDRDRGIVRVPLDRAQRAALEQRAKYLPSRPTKLLADQPKTEKAVPHQGEKP